MPQNDAKFTAVSDDDIKRKAQGYIRDALDIHDLDSHRQEALRYYMGEPYGNESDDNSQIVTTEVRDAVEWAVANLVDVFTSTDKVAQYLPRNAEDELEAEAQTDYANYVFMVENQGSIVLEQMFRDSLLARIGVVKVCWDEYEDVTTPVQEYNLPDPLFTAIASSDNVNILEHTSRDFDELNTTHDVTYQKRIKKGKTIVDNIPPADFIVTSDAKFDLRTGGISASAQGHRTKKSLSELSEMGFEWEDLLAAKTASDDDNIEQNIKDRYTNTNNTVEEVDDASREVWVTELYFKADRNGDGYPELLRVFLLGEKGEGAMLDAEEWDFPPFAAVTPILLSHTLHGLDYQDLVGELQMIKSTILREMVYNLYLTNRPRKKYKKGTVDVAELLDHTPGGLIECDGNPAECVQEDHVAYTAAASQGMLNYIDEIIENRTGVGRGLPSMDPKFLQSTSPSVMGSYETASQKKLKQVVKTAAALGIRYIFWLIKHNLQKYQDFEKVFQLNGEWRKANPAEWGDDQDVIIDVLPIAVNRESRLANLNVMAQRIEQAMQQFGLNNPIMGLKQYYNCMRQIINMGELGNPDMFINNPNKLPPEVQQQLSAEKPDPAIQKSIQELQLKKQEMEAKIQLERETAQAKIQIEREKAAADAFIRAKELDAEITLAQIEALFQIELKTNENIFNENVKRPQ